MEKYDVVVIGGGPAGYVAAIKSAQLGLKVACVEKRKTLGGTCLNVGCIPSKALLNSSKKYWDAKNNFSKYGINLSDIKLDLDKMLSNKDKVVLDLTRGIEGLFKKNQITFYNGVARILKNNNVSISNKNHKETISTKNIVISTGSEVVEIPGVEIDEKAIVSSTGALSLSAVPTKMIVIGGGYIGLEMASIWSRLGSDVEVIEFADRIVPNMDKEVGAQLQKYLSAQGIKFRLGTKVIKATKEKKSVLVELEDIKSSEKHNIKSDIVLVSVGRKPYTKNLGCDDVGIALDESGRVLVDSQFKTNATNIYAIGDVIEGPMLAHKAEEEGVAVAEIISGQAGHVNYNAIPSVIYTYPEVASVGKTEEELKKENIEYKAGKFPFMANSRARAVGETEGFVKILACAKTDLVLGVHIIGPEAGTIVSEAVTAMEYFASSEDIARICHAHPTLNEAVKEAALAITAKPLHI